MDFKGFGKRVEQQPGPPLIQALSTISKVPPLAVFAHKQHRTHCYYAPRWLRVQSGSISHSSGVLGQAQGKDVDTNGTKLVLGDADSNSSGDDVWCAGTVRQHSRR